MAFLRRLFFGFRHKSCPGERTIVYKFMRILPLLLIVFLSTISCTAQVPVKSVRHNEQKITILLDSTEAANTILKDSYDRFFERVTPAEMSIQMARPLDGTPLKDQKAQFAAFLQADMDHFTDKESKWVADIFKKVFETVNSFHPGIYPDSLLLIKTKGKHYGNSVYYTRNNCIIIPADVLSRPDKSAFTSTMYHEIFHVYSRLHPAKQKQLYSLIGFEHIGFDNLVMPLPLRDRVLFNPDGVDFGQKIHLKVSDTEYVDAIPVIYANNNGFTSEKATFFSYLEFELFKIVPTQNGQWRVETEEDGLTSTLSVAKLPDFFQQIKDNTSYIIHPDEVMADNFSFIMLDIDGKQASGKFSKEGKKLLKDVEAILKAN